MQKNEALNDIRNMLNKGHLGQAIGSLENYLLTHPQQRYMEQLMAIGNDYRLMVDYWQRGYDDAMRQQVYDGLLRRMFELATNMDIGWQVEHSPFLKAIHLRPHQIRKDWSIHALRADLEGFVSDVAMLQIEPDAARSQRETEVYEHHWNIVRDLFDYVLTSRQWKEGLADAFIDMLLSPTLDSADQQLIVSAITLAAMQHFCFQKFRVLMTVYRQTSDELVRQRALVGWVFTADASATTLFPEMRQMVADACSDEQCRNELTELQMQLYFCMDAENDTNTIQKEILPDIMSGSNLKITKKGLVEMDEDTLEDILHPEAAELGMERMEQSMRRMVDMQKQGADIYFGGFSQMKRYPFFNDISNWFVPFSGNHPAVRQIWNREKGHRFLQIITHIGAFCDSDKYSFVLAFDQVLERLPKSMLKMIEQGEATPMPLGGEIDAEEQKSAAFKRRMYLQDMYRFYRLYSVRSEFMNPFGNGENGSGDILFFSNELMKGTALEEHFTKVAAFLIKRKRNSEALRVLQNLSEENHTYQYYMMMGNILQHAKQYTFLSATECFRHALELQPDNEKALAGYARALFNEQHYEQALKTYDQLLKRQPEHLSYQLSAAVCMTNLGRSEEAQKQLYKLNYLNPDNNTVKRVLAWTLTIAGKFEQAEKLYNSLMEPEFTEPTDLLNYGYCLWFAGKVMNAIVFFRQFVDSQKEHAFSIEEEFLVTERQHIANHGISNTEVMLMIDAVKNANM